MFHTMVLSKKKTNPNSKVCFQHELSKYFPDAAQVHTESCQSSPNVFPGKDNFTFLLAKFLIHFVGTLHPEFL